MSTPAPRRLAAFALVVMSASSAPLAQADVFKCTSPDGTIEYRNTGDTKGCKRIDNAPVTVVPAPKIDQRRANIPNVVQKQRDDDRRTILEEELKAQEERLAQLKTEFNGGEPERRGDEKNYQKYLDRVAQLKDDIARTEANVASLRRELGR